MKSAAIGVLVFVLVFGNLLWFVERNANTFSKNYFPGIFESFWLVICSMSTDSFGDYVPHTWMGRVITIGIIVGGVAIFGLLVAQVTAFLAIKKIKGEINNSRDLVNKKVATAEETTSENILRRIGAKVIGVSKIEEAYLKLKNEEVDAIVFDAPVAIYYEKNDKDGKIEIIGEIFDKQKYGIALQQGSLLMEKINQAILHLKEFGQYDLFYRKWFGEDLVMES
ncbi:MAG: transporter substrate-binding domain-containing protein [Candidatus Yonathbacteria bacterium]|nr:transporter substrate-binding domain-containing protein [Candidatus Yonathbacteria bacterium]